ncbi:MAG: RluA family pseudouridine synthase [Calditrichaeota bacterium]|nr:RluA family pseudouridine synthase [Calditrichota bacterium]
MKRLKSFNIRSPEGRKQRVEVVFEDEHLVVINKPGGLRVIPDRWNPELPNLWHLLQARYQDLYQQSGQHVWVVHRIDAPTSGLVIFAKTAEMHRGLSVMFEKNQIEKTYLAIVSGEPPETQGTIDLPLQQHPTRKKYVIVHEKGKPAVTDYAVRERFQHFCLLEVKPRTGRTHQIRVHLQAIGCPLAVDPLYGEAESIQISNLKRDVVKRRAEWEETLPVLMNRLSLHAYRLKFVDPLSGEEREFEAPIPKDFLALLKALRKWDALPPQTETLDILPHLEKS